MKSRSVNRAVNPVNIDEHTWWYRERNGGMTLVREERDAKNQYVRTRQYRLSIVRGKISLRRLGQ